MNTIKNMDYRKWDELDYGEKLDVTINTLFTLGKINEEIEITIGDDYGEATIELSCIEDDEKLALTEGWICLKDGASFEVNLHRGDNSHYYIADEMWGDIFTMLESLEE